MSSRQDRYAAALTQAMHKSQEAKEKGPVALARLVGVVDGFIIRELDAVEQALVEATKIIESLVLEVRELQRERDGLSDE